jgi:hypothetical protein
LRPGTTRTGRNELNALDANLPPNAATSIRKIPEYDVIDFYACVRNAIVHGDGRSKVDRLHAQIVRTHRAYFETRYSKLRAPNTLATLRYDDHQLLVHCLLKIAARLNDACALEMTDILGEILSDPTLRNLLLRHRRQVDHFVAIMAQRYRLDATDAEWLRPCLDAFLAETPTHRERKRGRYRARRR